MMMSLWDVKHIYLIAELWKNAISTKLLCRSAVYMGKDK